jgi:hypothetical protein
MLSTSHRTERRFSEGPMPRKNLLDQQLQVGYALMKENIQLRLNTQSFQKMDVSADKMLAARRVGKAASYLSEPIKPAV